MATPKKKTAANAKKTPAKAKQSSTGAAATKVTRIQASEDTATPKPAKKLAKSSAANAPVAPKRDKRRNPLRAFGEYFAGAWYELRQVRWPNRRATWGMTGALLLFVAFFVIIILLLDALFKSIFQQLVA